MTDLEKINAYVESHRDEMLETYRKVILQESYHSAPEEVRTMGKMFKEMFEEVGFRCKLTNVGTDESGDMLTGILGEDRPGKPIIFGGHMDTVHKLGSFPCKFEVDDEGKVHGPGVLDMKGGIVIALYVCKALNEIGYNSRPLKICFAPDEEKLHKHGNTADQFVEFCKGGEFMLNMETGLPGGDLCVSRKGKTEVALYVEGVSAHAGNDFARGRNAIAELCKKVTDIQALTNLDAGTTVCVDVIHGGTNFGAFPAHAEATFDVRATSVEEMQKVKKQIEEIAAKTYIDGTTTTMEYQMEMLPFECTEGVMKLYHMVHDICVEDGFGDFPLKHIGGSSDAAYAVIAGVPSLCSCGIQDEWNHTTKEYAILESLYTRTKQWADVVNHIK